MILMSMSLTVFYTSLGAIGLMLALGFLLGKLKLITNDSNKVFINLLLSVFMPCALFIAFPSEFEQAAWTEFLQAVVASAIVLLSSIIIAKFLFSRRRLGEVFHQHQFAFIFNNTSFLGYPLVLTVFGQAAMIVYAGFMLCFNFALFTYGIWLFKQKLRWIELKLMIFNPNIIATILGLILFLTSTKLPASIEQAINYLAAVTTPLSLICVGFILSQVRQWSALLKKTRIFVTCLLQLLLVPILTYLILTLFQFPVLVRQMFTMLLALPTATSLAIFTEKYGTQRTEASQIVIISTLLSIVTLPLIMSFVFRLS